MVQFSLTTAKGEDKIYIWQRKNLLVENFSEVHKMKKVLSIALVLIMVLTILYIDNRYTSQQELIEIDRLKKELTDIKYDALTRSSELMEKSRQSRIEEYISTGDSPLETSTNRPYLIKKD